MKQKYTPKELGKILYFLEMDWYNGRFLCFYMKPKSAYAGQIFYRELDIENGTFKGQEEVLVKIEGQLALNTVENSGDIISDLVEGYTIALIPSYDKSKILIQYRRPPELKNDAISHDLIGMYVFDEELKEIAHNEIDMPYTEQQMDNYAYHINSDGIPYILAKVRDDKSAKNYTGSWNKQINYHLELLSVDLAKHNFKKIILQEKGCYLRDLKLQGGPNNSIICAGLYIKTIDKFYTHEADGIALFRIDGAGKLQQKVFHEIPLEVINLYEEKKVRKANTKKEQKGTARLSHLQMKDIMVQEDNSVVFFAERHLSEGGGAYTTSYHYDDILTAKITPEGQLAWMKKLPKRQVNKSILTQGLSYKHLRVGNKHYCIFIDHVKNMNLSTDEAPETYILEKGGPLNITTYREGNLTAYAINDATGKVKKITLFNIKKIKGDYKIQKMSMSNIVDIFDHEFVVRATVQNKQDIMIKVTFK
ncbi:MAG: hypothetical protein ACRBFS_11645 [Aureispira sp.]